MMHSGNSLPTSHPSAKNCKASPASLFSLHLALRLKVPVKNQTTLSVSRKAVQKCLLHHRIISNLNHPFFKRLCLMSMITGYQLLPMDPQLNQINFSILSAIWVSSIINIVQNISHSLTQTNLSTFALKTNHRQQASLTSSTSQHSFWPISTLPSKTTTPSPLST